MSSSKRPIIDVHIGGQKRPVRFGMTALARFCDERDIPLASLQDLGPDTMKPGDMLSLVHVGLQDGARKRAEQGQQPPRAPENWDTVGDWVDEAGMEVIQEVLGHFQASIGEEDEGGDEDTSGKAPAGESP